MRTGTTIPVLTVSFGAVMVLMIVLTAIALDRIQSDFQNINSIVRENNVKTRLVNQMRTAARDRTVNLQKMVSSADPFAREEAYVQFNNNGGLFAEARIALLAMELTDEEKAILGQQAALTRTVVPMQRRIADLAIMEENDEANRLLVEGGIPKQDRVFVYLTRLQNLQEEAAEQVVSQANREFFYTKTVLLILAGSIIFISFLIALFVVRRTSLSEKSLFKEKERAQVTLHSIGDGVITTDAAGNVEHINSIATLLTGWSNADAHGTPAREVFRVVRDSDREPLQDPVSRILAEQTVITSDRHTTLVCGDANEFAIEYTASPIFSSDKSIIGAVLVFRDVTEMRALSHQLSYQASHDSLSGLINRREFEARMERLLANIGDKGEVHTLCYLDLDQFKIVNDTCGHIAGDELLKQVATRLKSHVRESDLLARLGGDEFGILFLNCSTEKARLILEEIRKSANDMRFVWDDKSFNVGVSVGVVSIDGNSANLYSLLSAADTACYVAKDEGRNRIHVYQSDDHTLALREGEMQWVHRISSALEDNRFRLYQQLIEPLAADTPELHCEIMLRMVDENGAEVPPMAFIPAAERYNLMSAIDRWVVRNTLDALDQRGTAGMQAEQSFAVNISGQSLCEDNFLDYVQQQIAQHRTNPSQLCFEITETSAIVNLTRAMHFIATLKQLGCRFSLDDFGSGLSSFAYLKNLPVDYLKIDGGFIRDIADDPMDRALVESINQIGHVMGIRTIAEYVETPEILAVLREIGVDYAQGYGIVRPVPLSTLANVAVQAAR
ncbi:MAG: EAL domain-containing protein [Pseudomonadota bacterium]|nr:MAG: EAL domain-containing protein [Pseudomonadota bacterium]